MSYTIEQRDEQLVGSHADIVYDISFERAPQHLVRVVVTVSNVKADEVEFVMPSWTPGSYKIRDYAGLQGNVIASTGDGGSSSVAAAEWRDKARIVVKTKGASVVRLEYIVYGNERTVRTNHINRNHAFISPAATFMYVAGRENEIHHVRVHHDRQQWPNVSTQLSPVTTESNVTVLGALNYDILVDSPLEIGNHQVRTFELLGARHEVALVSNVDLDIDWITEQTKTIVKTEASVFGGVPYDRYVLIIQAFPNAAGGLEHARSSVNQTDPSALLDHTKAIGLLSLLCHEYFHLWNIKRIRPVGLGPFDYTRETYTPMLWLAEGVTSYYDDLFAYRCGFMNEKDYLSGLAKDVLGKLDRVSGRKQMSVRDSSYLAWVKLYMASPDGGNRFPSYYLKGGLVFLLLDIYIIDHTDGKKTFDDCLRGLWEVYQKTPHTGMTEDEVIAVMERASGVQLREIMMRWLSTTAELPVEETLALVGIKYSVVATEAKTDKFGMEKEFIKVPPSTWVGWSLADNGGRIIVRTIDDDSPAQVAGIGIDDEILAIGGKRVTSPAVADQTLQLANGKTVDLTAQCDGIVYSTTITAVPQTTYKLEPMADPTERQKELKAVWLKR